jgi:integrase
MRSKEKIMTPHVTPSKIISIFEEIIKAMSDVRFNLKNPSSDEPTLIHLIFIFNHTRFKYSTSEKIHPDFWNTTKQRAKETSKFPEYPEFNARLDKLEGAIKTIYRRLLNDNTVPTVERMKSDLDIALLKANVKEKIDLFGFIDKYCEESKATKKNTTIKSYKVSKKHLDDYCKHIGKKVSFEDIDLDFYNSFLSFLTLTEKLSQNSIGTHIKNLKVFMNEATERGINANLDFKRRKFKKVTEDTDKVYLSQSEIDVIYKLDLNENKKLEKVRDLFIVGCCTGLRFSDFSQLTEENYINGDKIRIKTQKTGEIVVIPMHRYIKELIKKYDGELPRIISNQKMNEYLKDVCKLAKLNEKVESSLTKGGVMKKTVSKKYKVISSHTARRSFATNLFLADIPAITIMKITGHRTEKSFLRYIRISQEENANKLLNHPFFN